MYMQYVFKECFVHRRDETAFWLPRGFEKEHKYISNTGDGNTRAEAVIAAVVSDHSVCLWTARGGTLWTKQNTHANFEMSCRCEWSEASHSEHRHVIGHYKVDVWDFKYLNDV